MVQAKRFYVSGMVQGVGYRFFAQRVAGKLGIAGYVKNLRDGRVEVYAIGRGPELDSLHNELRRGPRSAMILEVTAEDAEVDERYGSSFSIERDT